MRSVKRLRQRLTVFGALLGVVAIVSGVGVGLIGYLGNAEAQGVRVELASRTGADSGLEVSLTRDDDWQAQDERVRELIGEQFRDGERSIPITVDRTVEAAAAVPLELPGGEPTPSGTTSAVVLSVPGLSERASLVDGAWPVADDEVSVQADAAAALGLAVGTRFTLGEATVTVTATWRAIDPLDVRWLGDQRVVNGFSGRSYGPIVVGENAWAAIDKSTRARWTIAPVVAEIQSSDLAAIVTAWRGMRSSLRDAGVDTSSYDERGRLARTAVIVQARVDALRAVQPVALLVIGAVAVTTLIELTRLLGALRASELRLMWSRGATARGLAAGSAAEAAIVGVIGAAAGVGIAVPVLFVLGDRNAIASSGVALWLVPAAAALTAAVITFGSTLVATRSFSRHDKPDEAGRVRRAAGPGAIVIVTVAAALSTWQLLLYGSPVTPSSDGGSQVDPVAVVAPALALLSLVLLVLLALPLTNAPAERAARRARGATRSLVPRTLVRRIGTAATPLIVIGLAVGQIVIAAGYSQTWDNAYTVTSQLRAGTELRLTGSLDDLGPERLQSVIDSDTVTAVAPVFQDSAIIGLDAAALVGVAPSALRDLATRASGLFDGASAAGALTDSTAGITVPEGATELEVSIETHGFAGAPPLALLLDDEYGSTRTLPLDDDYRAPLPALDPGVPGTWRVTGFEVTLPPGVLGPVDYEAPLPTIEVTELTVGDGTELPLTGTWTATSIDTVTSPLEVTGSLPSAVVTDFDDKVRILPALDDTPPAVISQALADRNSIDVDDVLFLPIDPRTENMRLVVTAIVPAIPGAQYDAAVLVDVGLVQAVQQRLYAAVPASRQVWVEAADDAAAIEALRDGLPAGVRIQSLAIDPSRDILQSASVALWVGAVGASLLALVAIAAVIGAQVRARRPEALLLRALGLGARPIASMRRAELATAQVAGIVIGLAAGLVVTVLTVPALARAAVPEPFPSLPTTVAVDMLPLAAALAALVALLLALLALYAARVARQVRLGSSAGGDR